MAPPPRAARPSPPPRVAQPPRGAPSRASRPAPAPRAVERARPGPRQAVQPQRIERQQQRALQRQERVQQRQERVREAQPQQQERAQRVRENRQEFQALRNKQRQDLRAKGLTAPDRQKLRAEQRQQLQDLRVKQRERAQADRLGRDVDRQDRQRVERPDRAERRAAGPRAAERDANRQQRDAQRAQRIQQRQQLREQRASNRADRRVSRDEARAGRFAARFGDRRHARAERLIARHAWRHGRRAAFVAWIGPIFYPYLYSDFFDYTFFPYAFDDGYWAYAYDDFIDGVFFAYGSPYADDPGAAPLAQIVPPATTGTASPQGPALRPQTRRTVEQVCNPTQALTAWPFRQIEAAVRPTAEQQKLFEGLKAAADEAAETFKSSCKTDFAMTPTGRLDAMTSRLEASLDALAVLRPALEAFYNSLTDEQRARFDAIGPDLGRAEARAARNKAADTNACGGDKAGLSAVPIETLRDRLKPNDQQQALLDKLDDATNAAVDALTAACPDAIPLTPTGRLEAMEKRLTAMVDAAETIRPALEQFYGSLTSEQKAQFNTLGRQAQRGN